MRKNKRRTLCLLLGLCVFAMSGCNFGRQAQTEQTDPPVQEQEQGGQTTEIVVPDAENEAVTEPDTQTQEETPAAKPEEKKTQTKPFWQSGTSLQYENLTAVAAAAAQDYYINGPKRGWMSKNGKLYGYYDGAYITPAMLVSEGYLESGLDTTGYELLLINGSDLAELDGANVPAGSMNYGVFAAVKQNNKYLIASPEGKVGAISQESYTALLAKYNQNHGTVGRLSSAAAEYDRILNYICLYEGRFSDYYVREIRKDNKYAVVTFSPYTDTSAVKQYILKNDNGFWEVVYPNVQMDAYPIYAINRLIPDFNTALLPDYNLASWKNYILQEQGGAVAALFSARFITSRSEIYYQCATADCAYFRLTDGSRVVAYRAGDSWTAEKVTSDIAAKNYFIAKTGADCSFIILDD